MLSVRFIRYSYVLIVIVCAYLFLSGASAYAQEEQGIQLQPAIIDISGQPGTSVKTSVVLTNTFSEPVGVSVQSRSLAPDDELIDPGVVDRYDASLWVKLAGETFLIDKFASVEVPIEIVVPDDAVPGGHYTLVSFRLISNEAPDGSGVKINREAGTVMLITVPGDLVESADIETINEEAISSGGVSRFSHSVMNRGNSHILPIITTTVYNANNGIVDTINQPTKLLLPNTKRQIDVEWDSDRYFGSFHAVTTVTFGTPIQNLDSKTIDIRIVPAVSTLLLWLVGGSILVRAAHKFMYKNNKSYRDSFNKNQQQSAHVRNRIIKRIKPGKK